MGEEGYPLVGFSEWFDDPRKYAWKSVTIEGTLTGWEYRPDREPIGMIVAAMVAFSRVAELRMWVDDGDRK